MWQTVGKIALKGLQGGWKALTSKVSGASLVAASQADVIVAGADKISGGAISENAADNEIAARTLQLAGKVSTFKDQMVTGSAQNFVENFLHNNGIIDDLDKFEGTRDQKILSAALSFATGHEPAALNKIIQLKREGFEINQEDISGAYADVLSEYPEDQRADHQYEIAAKTYQRVIETVKEREAAVNASKTIDAQRTQDDLVDTQRVTQTPGAPVVSASTPNKPQGSLSTQFEKAVDDMGFFGKVVSVVTGLVGLFSESAANAIRRFFTPKELTDATNAIQSAASNQNLQSATNQFTNFVMGGRSPTLERELAL